MSIYDDTDHAEENIRDPFKAKSEPGNPYKNLDPDPDPSMNRSDVDPEEQQVRDENMFDSEVDEPESAVEAH